MGMSRDEIFAKVRDVLEEALGADEDEITSEASLTADLEAESIDFLDIVFRLEKAFSTDDAPFKVSQGELFPENLMEKLQEAQMKRELGVPAEQVLKELGYEPTDQN